MSLVEQTSTKRRLDDEDVVVESHLDVKRNSQKVNRAKFVYEHARSEPTSGQRISQANLGKQHKRMLTTLRTFEQLCGTKHPESRAIAERLYGELTREILIRHSPLNMPLKVDRVRF